MISKLSFRTDPVTPYHTLNQYLRKADRSGIKESTSDEGLYGRIILRTAENLCQLLNIPNEFNIAFLPGLSLLHKSIHTVFKNRLLIPETDEINSEGSDNTRPYMHSSSARHWGLGDTRNEDSMLCFKDIDPNNGRKMTVEGFFHNADYPLPLNIHCDVSYSVPSAVLNYNQIQSFFFHTHFGFGMPPGTSIWIARNPLFSRIMTSMHELADFKSFVSGAEKTIIFNDSEKIENLYALGMIISDLHSRGLQMIRNEIKYKSIVLHNALKDSRQFEPLVADLKDQSENIICGRTKVSKNELYDYFSGLGVEVDLFLDDQQNTIVRMANYPAHSKEQVEYLSDLLTGL